MQFQLLKVETQSVQICWICTTFRYNQTQFKRVEVPSLGHHTVHKLISSIIWTRKNTISFKSKNSLAICEYWNEEKKYIERLQMNISNSYYKKRKHHLHLQSAQFIYLIGKKSVGKKWRIFALATNIFYRRNLLPTKFFTNGFFLPTNNFYWRIIFTDELVFLFGQYFAFCCLKTP